MSDIGAQDQEVTYVSPIATPLAGAKLEARALKLVKKAISSKGVKRGVPEVVKALRKGQKGVVLFAADIFPLDVAAHVPVLCEEKNVAYAYVKSRKRLGGACQTNRAASVLMVVAPDEDSSYLKTFKQVEEGVRAVNEYVAN